MNYREAYMYGREELDKAGIAEADLDARVLLEASCHTDRGMLYSHPEWEPDPAQVATYTEAIRRRCMRIPLQQITGEQEFMGLSFSVNEDTLIPRQDTETLVEEAMKHLHGGMRILDLCTGSGCILLSLLKYSNETKGLGIDLSAGALRVAGKNAEQLGLDGRATFLQSDLTKEIPDWLKEHGEAFFAEEYGSVERRFDMIVSNPPYIQSAVIPTLEPEVAQHEPMMALDGGEDGLFFYREIVEQAKPFLRTGGELFFEIGHDESEAVAALMKEAGYLEIRVIRDLCGNPRVVTGIRN